MLISPGPGRPEDAGVSSRLIGGLGRSVPVLGVCLGHQCIGEVFGGEVVRAAEVMHGKTSIIRHDGRGSSPASRIRWWPPATTPSWSSPASVPAVLEVTATTEDGTIMGLRHRSLPIEGVQFHPESILTAEGHRLLANWLSRCGQPDALARVG